MKKTAIALTAVLLVGILAFGARPSLLPPNGVVPDEQVAVKVAEVLLPPVFGAEQVTKFQPYHAQLDTHNVWTVYGTLKRGSRGGTPMLRIQKSDGKVLAIWHSQ